MAFAVPVIIGIPIGYFTWSKVFDAVDNSISLIIYKDTSNGLNKDGTTTLTTRPPSSHLTAALGTAVSVGVLAKLTFPPNTRHRLFFAKAPPNSNIRVETLKLGMELLVRAGIVFYGGATFGAISGRLAVVNKKSS